MRIFNRFLLVVAFGLCFISFFQMVGYVAAPPAYGAAWAASSQKDLLEGRQPKIAGVFWRMLAGTVLLVGTVVVSVKTKDTYFMD